MKVYSKYSSLFSSQSLSIYHVDGIILNAITFPRRKFANLDIEPKTQYSTKKTDLNFA
jgi:hypothetical protein